MSEITLNAETSYLLFPPNHSDKQDVLTLLGRLYDQGCRRATFKYNYNKINSPTVHLILFCTDKFYNELGVDLTIVERQTVYEWCQSLCDYNTQLNDGIAPCTVNIVSQAAVSTLFNERRECNAEVSVVQSLCVSKETQTFTISP